MGSGARPDSPELTRVVLRTATAFDLAEVTALEDACYSDPWPEKAFASLPDNTRVFFSVARVGVHGQVAGYVVAWYVLDEGELANLAVAPTLRRQGIGGVLLEAMLADASARGISHVFLEVRESNTAARKLYRARGFEEIGRRKSYYRSPVEDALILRRTLEP